MVTRSSTMTSSSFFQKLYGEEKKIGAPGEEYICLAEANEAAAPASNGSGSKVPP